MNLKFSYYFLFMNIACIFLMSCSKKTTTVTTSKTCVEIIIEQDAALGKTRNHNCEKISLSQTIEKYTSALKALNYEGCNNEVEAAFNDHIAAWDAMTKVTDKHDSLRGEMHDLFDQIELSEDKVEFKTLLLKIWNTWEIFNDIAIQQSEL